MPSTDLYDALRASHVLQRELLRKLLRSKPATRERVELFTATRIELAAHEAAEERFLYVPMLMDDMGLHASRHALHEHHEIDELVEKLQEGEPSDRGWMATANACVSPPKLGVTFPSPPPKLASRVPSGWKRAKANWQQYPWGDVVPTATSFPSD